MAKQCTYCQASYSHHSRQACDRCADVLFLAGRETTPEQIAERAAFERREAERIASWIESALESAGV